MKKIENIYMNFEEVKCPVCKNKLFINVDFINNKKNKHTCNDCHKELTISKENIYGLINTHKIFWNNNLIEYSNIYYGITKKLLKENQIYNLSQEIDDLILSTKINSYEKIFKMIDSDSLKTVGENIKFKISFKSYLKKTLKILKNKEYNSIFNF